MDVPARVLASSTCHRLAGARGMGMGLWVTVDWGVGCLGYGPVSPGAGSFASRTRMGGCQGMPGARRLGVQECGRVGGRAAISVRHAPAPGGMGIAVRRTGRVRQGTMPAGP